MTTIELYGDRSGYLGTDEVKPNKALNAARVLAKRHAEHLSEPVEARVMRGDSMWFAVRHVPGVTRL